MRRSSFPINIHVGDVMENVIFLGIFYIIKEINRVNNQSLPYVTWGSYTYCKLFSVMPTWPTASLSESSGSAEYSQNPSYRYNFLFHSRSVTWKNTRMLVHLRADASGHADVTLKHLVKIQLLTVLRAAGSIKPDSVTTVQLLSWFNSLRITANSRFTM